MNELWSECPFCSAGIQISGYKVGDTIIYQCSCGHVWEVKIELTHTLVSGPNYENDVEEGT